VSSFDGAAPLRRVDPRGDRHGRKSRATADEAVGVTVACGIGDGLAHDEDLVVVAPMQRVRRDQADAAVAVFVVVPAEGVTGPGAGVLDRAEATGIAGTVLEGLELRLAEGVVVRDVRPAQALRDAEVTE
jgi:hypothetical protein